MYILQKESGKSIFQFFQIFSLISNTDLFLDQIFFSIIIFFIFQIYFYRYIIQYYITGAILNDDEMAMQHAIGVSHMTKSMLHLMNLLSQSTSTMVGIKTKNQHDVLIWLAPRLVSLHHLWLSTYLWLAVDSSVIWFLFTSGLLGFLWFIVITSFECVLLIEWWLVMRMFWTDMATTFIFDVVVHNLNAGQIIKLKLNWIV